MLTILATLVLGYAWLNRPEQLGDPLPDFAPRYDELKDRIDPNTASAEELSVLPGLGPSKAQAIVDFRQTHPEPAFRSPEDLGRVRGIGPSIIATLRPYLYFEGAPTSRPASGSAD